MRIVSALWHLNRSNDYPTVSWREFESDWSLTSRETFIVKILCLVDYLNDCEDDDVMYDIELLSALHGELFCRA